LQRARQGFSGKVIVGDDLMEIGVGEARQSMVF
jgi:hypothetical protein